MEDVPSLPTTRAAPRQSRSRITQQSLLDAAEILLQRSKAQGLGFGMADVAEITGVSEATGYRYFENVEALLTAVGVRHFQTVNREIREASQVADGDNRDPVRRTVEANVRIHRRHADLHRLFTGEMSTHLASMRTSQPRFDYEGSAYAHVAASLTTYDFRDDEERLRVARLVFDLCESTTHSVIVDHMVDMTDEELIDQITTAIHAVLHPYQSA